MKVGTTSSTSKVRKKAQPNPQNWTKGILWEKLFYDVSRQVLSPEEKLLRAVFGEPATERGNGPTLVGIFIEFNKLGTNWEEYRDGCKRWVTTQLEEGITPETEAMKKSIEDVLNTLPPRENKVIQLRFGFVDGRSHTLGEVGKEFKVTPERIRQIEGKALRKLRHPSRGKHLHLCLQDGDKTQRDLYNKMTKQFPGNEKIEALCQLFLEDPETQWNEMFRMMNRDRRVAGEAARALLERLTSLPIGDQEQFAGFFEGDGSIGVAQGLMLNITQRDRRILDYYNTLLQLSRPIRYMDSIDCHWMVIERFYYKPLLIFLCRHLVMPGRVRQVQEASDMYGLDLKPVKHEPTLRWIVGMFDAEGCVTATQGTFPGMSVSQKDITVLEDVQRIIGGRISNISLYLRRDEVWKFLPTYVRYSRNPQKLERLYALLYWIQRQRAPKAGRGAKPRSLPEGVGIFIKELKTRLGR